MKVINSTIGYHALSESAEIEDSTYYESHNHRVNSFFILRRETMLGMVIHQRNYRVKPTKNEYDLYNEVLHEERPREIRAFGRRNLRSKYPKAIRHFLSLFPNNHIELIDYDKELINEKHQEFEEILNNGDTTERDILNYINHRDAFFIIASILIYQNYGHHDAYIFPEFSIGDGKYYADYLLIGKNSGGYEFMYVELEAPNARTTIRKGYDGVNQRQGLIQIEDWKMEIESNYAEIAKEFLKHTDKELPNEFSKLDRSRIHYAVITGRRADYNDITYRLRRERLQDNNIEILHYDNLLDYTYELLNRTSF